MIRKILLSHFRNHQNIEIESNSKHIFISGANGIGKTNILEAISLFSTGRSLKNASKGEEMLNFNNNTSNIALKLPPHILQASLINKSWEIILEYQATHSCTNENSTVKQLKRNITDSITLKYNNKDKKKQLTYNQEKTKNIDLAKQIKILWLTPEMDSLFSGSTNDRRQFIDRLVYSFNTEHATDITQYSKHIQSRLRFLKQFTTEEHKITKWLSALENTIAHLTMRILLRREAICYIFNEHYEQQQFNKDFSELHRIHFSMHYQNTFLCYKDIINDLLHHNQFANKDHTLHNLISSCQKDTLNKILEQDLKISAKYLQAVDHIKKELQNSRKKDTIIGKSMYGPHRSDLQISWMNKNTVKQIAACDTAEYNPNDNENHKRNLLAAKHCSTGEQKSILLSIVLNHTMLLGQYIIQEEENNPSRAKKSIILLLDDAVAYLDKIKQDSFMKMLNLTVKDIAAQAWISSVELKSFHQKFSQEYSNDAKLIILK